MKIIENELKDIIFSIFPNEAKLSYEDWNYVLNKASFNTVFHSKKTVDYYVSYYHEQNSLNLSIVLYENKNPVGIFPLMVHGKELKTVSSNGFEILEPIFIKNIGRKVKNHLAAGTILKVRHLDTSYLVNEEDTVLVVAANNSITITTSAIALEKGQLGDMIKVKNLNSGKLFKVIITDDKKVSPITNM